MKLVNSCFNVKPEHWFEHETSQLLLEHETHQLFIEHKTHQLLIKHELINS
jgi:hypothetical protein